MPSSWPVQKTSEEVLAELWKPGARSFFEYHCYEGHDSSDAILWYHSHQEVTVLGFDPTADNEFLEGKAARADAGLPLVYLVRFSDGLVGSAWEDELLSSSSEYERPAPPACPIGPSTS